MHIVNKKPTAKCFRPPEEKKTRVIIVFEVEGSLQTFSLKASDAFNLAEELSNEATQCIQVNVRENEQRTP